MEKQKMGTRTDVRVQQAVEQADAVCAAAMAITPPAYRHYLTLLPQNKRLAEGVFATIRVPYMAVDGRVKMAQDEHQARGATLRMQTGFEPEPLSGQLLCRAVVTSSLYGETTAHARVFLDGGGFADKTNPLETAETSAIGRALGFMGYGLYGTGIASAEEVERAQAARVTVPEGVDPATGEVQERPPSARQVGFLRSLLEQANVDPQDIATQLAALTTSRAASIRITELREALLDRKEDDVQEGTVPHGSERFLSDDGWREELKAIWNQLPTDFRLRYQKDLVSTQTAPGFGAHLLSQARDVLLATAEHSTALTSDTPS